MKEIVDLHEKIRALGTGPHEDHPVNFSRVEIENLPALLPAELMAELETLQARINSYLPDDMDYVCFVGGEEKPIFDFSAGGVGVGVPPEKPFIRDESLFPQLQAMDWEALRASAVTRDESLEGLARIFGATTHAPRSTKLIQRDFKEQMKVFIRERRADASRIHVMWYTEEDGLLAREVADAGELREMLPTVLFGAGEVVTIVAFGKPLPVDRIDALMSEAHQRTRPLLDAALANIEKKYLSPEGAIDVESSEAIDVESSVSEANEPKGS